MIQFIRGESKRLKFQIQYCDLTPVTTSADTVSFTLLKADGTTAFEKTLDSGIEFDTQTYYYAITLAATDTEDLDAGEYHYVLKVTFEDFVKIGDGNIRLTKE